MQDEVFSLKEAVERIPLVDGKRPSVATLFRWYDKGSSGIKLKCLRIGRKLCTTQKDLDAFFREAGAAGPQRHKRRVKKPTGEADSTFDSDGLKPAA
jgi:hypothetical protein